MKTPANRNPLIYWLPRIASLCFVALLMLFSLDVFEEGRATGKIALGLFMHNIPALILLAVTIVAWKREMVGAVVYILAGFAYIITLALGRFEWYMLSWAAMISGPAFGIGILFLLGGLEKKYLKKSN